MNENGPEANGGRRWPLIGGLLLLLAGGPVLVIGGVVVQGAPQPGFAAESGSGVTNEDLAWVEPRIEFSFSASPESWKTLVAIPATGGFRLKDGETWTSYPELDVAAFESALRPWAEAFPDESGTWSDSVLLVRMHRDAPYARLAELESILKHPDLRLWKLGMVVRSGARQDVRWLSLYMPVREGESSALDLELAVKGSGEEATYSVGDHSALLLEQLVAWGREHNEDGWGDEPTRLVFAPDISWGAIATFATKVFEPEGEDATWGLSLEWQEGLHVRSE